MKEGTVKDLKVSIEEDDLVCDEHGIKTFEKPINSINNVLLMKQLYVIICQKINITRNVKCSIVSYDLEGDLGQCG